MEAKELMVNDLVWYVDEPIKVKHNYGKSVRYDDDHCSHEVEQSYIKPIPLTEDILKANGFVNSANNAVERWLVYSDYDNSIVIEYKIFSQDFSKQYKTKTLLVVGRDCKGGVNRVHLLDIFHVHELQHALRLCGLGELADNFKIAD